MSRHYSAKSARVRTRGSVSVEAVLIIPAFLVFLALLAAIGRTAMVRDDIHAAVVMGARVASMQTNSTDGKTAATQAISAHLARDGTPCVDREIVVNAAALDLPPGQSGSVTATVTCVVLLSDLGVPGLPGKLTSSESFSTAIDIYAER
jgi:Flp pilus assembly protein TadG